MKAAVLNSPRVMVVEDIPKFPLEPGMVMVEVEACGVCGSDLRYFIGENPWALHTLGKALPNPPNIVMGHEFAGTVVEAGSRDGEPLIGRRVAVLCFKTCGECNLCLTGRSHLCKQTRHIGHGAGWGKRDYYPGAMAEYCIAWSDYCYELPEHVSSEEAALLDVVGVGVHASGLPHLKEGDTVAVFGCGPIGSAIMQAARARGASRVLVTDIYKKALDIAQELKADLIIDVKESSPAEVILSATGGKGCEVVFDTVGTAQTVDDGLSVLAEGGSFITLAVHGGQGLDVLRLGAERSFRTSANFKPEEYPYALALLETGKINVKPWITHRFPLADVPKAIEMGLEKEKHGLYKAMILP